DILDDSFDDSSTDSDIDELLEGTKGGEGAEDSGKSGGKDKSEAEEEDDSGSDEEASCEAEDEEGEPAEESNQEEADEEGSGKNESDDDGSSEEGEESEEEGSDDDDEVESEPEAWFYMRVGVSYKQKEITSESMSIKAKKNLDPELRASLTDADDGILRPGALPKIQTASAAGNKALLDSLAKVTAAPKKKKEKVEAEEVEPKTWAEKASDSLGDLLQDAAKARTLSIKLGPVQYASELALQMKNHANHLEKLYHNIRVALDKKSDDKTYKKLLNQVAEGAAFTTKSQAAANAFLKPPSKKKKKETSTGGTKTGDKAQTRPRR
ncbi:unnamed protein product, partial [Durusdinium trenchii]